MQEEFSWYSSGASCTCVIFCDNRHGDDELASDGWWKLKGLEVRSWGREGDRGETDVQMSCNCWGVRT